MKILHHGLKIALLALLCHAGPLSSHAQNDDGPGKGKLDKPVTLKVTRERLADVLNELAKKGYFTFSYQSDIIKKDRLVTLTLRESTLREALQLVLGKGYDYVEADDYVVIRRKDGLVEPKTRKQPLTPEAFKQPVVPKAKKERLVEEISPEVEAKKATVREIIRDMAADSIIKDKDSFSWFGLDNSQFIVDGRPVADSLRVKFAAKYIRPDGMGYYYGPVTIHGMGTFFDKNDIYPQ
jgi:hypothetical protein